MLRYDRKLYYAEVGRDLQFKMVNGVLGFDRKISETVMARLCICNGTAVHTAVHCSESARLCLGCVNIGYECTGAVR